MMSYVKSVDSSMFGSTKQERVFKKNKFLSKNHLYFIYLKYK